MKHFRLLTLILFLAVASTDAFSQRYYRHTPPRPDYGYSRILDRYYGFRIGLSASHVNSDDKYLDGGDTQTGLNVGFVMGIGLTQRAPLYLEAGLSYIEKGGKGNYLGNKFTYDLNYLEVPLVLKYRARLDNNLTIDPFFGGYLSCGVGGKIKDFGDRMAESSFSSDNFNRFDGGLRVGCGISYDMLYAEVGYDFGLANICNDAFDSSHNGAFFANLGINF